jgi:hypothetical protein
MGSLKAVVGSCLAPWVTQQSVGWSLENNFVAPRLPCGLLNV